MKPLLFALLIFPLCLAAQNKTTDLVGVKFGYNSTNISIKESVDTKANLFGVGFDFGNTFVGDGIYFGLAKNIDDHLYIETSAAFFKGGEQTLSTGNYINMYQLSYQLKGYRIPISVNYLLRNEKKRLRFNLGAGLQYLHFSFQQYETLTASGVITNKVATDLDKSEVQFLINPGIQYRIVDGLSASFNVNVGISKRYSDAPIIALKYVFQRKMGAE